MDATTTTFLVIELAVAGMVYIFSSQCLKLKQNNKLDKILLFVVYIIVAVCVRSIFLSSLDVNSLSHIHVDTNILSSKECQEIIDAANMEAGFRHGWTTRRHKAYPTTDISVYDMNNSLGHFVSWLNNTIERRVYPKLIDNFDVSRPALEMRDLFIVKYDEHGQPSLPEHRDNSRLSFNLALTSHGNDFEGGGTTFTIINETINVDKGSLLSHDSGIYHAGAGVKAGTRYILIGFVNLQTTKWWRVFGTHASCLTYPSMHKNNSIFTSRQNSMHREMKCRSALWLMGHQMHRTLRNIEMIFSGDDGSTINVDTSTKLLMLFLCCILIILLLLLLYVCCQRDFSKMSHFDIVLMSWFSLLSEEEQKFLDLQKEQELCPDIESIACAPREEDCSHVGASRGRYAFLSPTHIYKHD